MILLPGASLARCINSYTASPGPHHLGMVCMEAVITTIRNLPIHQNQYRRRVLLPYAGNPDKVGPTYSRSLPPGREANPLRPSIMFFILHNLLSTQPRVQVLLDSMKSAHLGQGWGQPAHSSSSCYSPCRSSEAKWQWWLLGCGGPLRHWALCSGSIHPLQVQKVRPPSSLNMGQAAHGPRGGGFHRP